MKNKIFIGVGLAILVIAGLIFWSVQSGVLGDEFEMIVYSKADASQTYGTVYVSFVKSTSDTINAWIDLNKNSTFEESEKVISNFPFKSGKNWRTGFAVKINGPLPENPRLKIELDGGDNVEATLKVTQAPTEDLLELNKVTKPEEAMKGFGQVVFAQGTDPATEAVRYDVPDLGQRIAECAPTAAANSIISLAEEHGISLSDLPTGTEIVDGLKGDMDWTPENGVLPDDFVEGKNKWAAKNGLPIRTEKVGDQHGRNTLQEILDAMAAQGGAAAEIRMKFADANGKVKGGHMVTVVGIRVVGDQTFLDINDPRTPAGTDTYEVSGNVIEGYPYDGLAIVSWGFVQRWEGSPTGAALDPLTDKEVQGIQNFAGVKEKIKVIVVNGKKVPLDQVHVGKGPECDSETKQYPHYHANSEKVTALDGTVIVDPNGCGYGKVKDIPVEEVEKP